MSFESSVSVYDLETDQLTTVASMDGSTLSEPAWSPDGSRIAFASVEATLFAATASVGLVDAAGGEVTEVGRGEGSFISTPTWSPDGTWIVATSQGGAADFRTTLFAIDVAGDRPSVVLATGVLSVIAWRSAD
jgi:Tol biopolymer transport system component